VQIRGDVTVQAPPLAVTTGMIVVPALWTGMVAASTRAVLTTSPSTGTASR